MMSNSSYKYAGLPLTPLMLQELILELLKGQTLHKQEMTDIIEATHAERGGNPPRSKQNGDKYFTHPTIPYKLFLLTVSDIISVRFRTEEKQLALWFK